MGEGKEDMGTDVESEFLIRILKSNRRVFFKDAMEMKAKRLQERNNATLQQRNCLSAGQRLCEDGSCIARIELCPEEQLMNQNTILIMVVVGLAVVLFLVILYCFQQRQSRRHPGDDGDTGLTENDYDHASLYAPPPDYEEVVTTNLYPPTPEQLRFQHHRRKSSDEPMTPPPNYDAALIILAKSQDSIFTKTQRKSSLFRRSISLEQVDDYEAERSPSLTNNNDCETPKYQKKRRSIFRFSRQFSRPLSVKDYTSVPSRPSSRPPSEKIQYSPQSSPLPPYSPAPPLTPEPPVFPAPLTQSCPAPQSSVVPPSSISVPPDSTVTVPPDSSVSVPPDSSVTVPPDSSVTVPPDSSVTVPPDSSVPPVSTVPPSSPDVHLKCLPFVTEETVS